MKRKTTKIPWGFAFEKMEGKMPRYKISKVESKTPESLWGFSFEKEGRIPPYRISKVDKGLARQAGLQKDDIIYSINDKEITGNETLLTMLKEFKKNPKELKVQILRPQKSILQKEKKEKKEADIHWSPETRDIISRGTLTLKKHPNTPWDFDFALKKVFHQ
jgi:membrane-associated protease RseP (regulator of RpoE activity)